jgi:voltage-dependent anion channel protein 2
VKLEVKTTAPNGVQFTVNGAKDNKSGAIAGDLKGKWTDKSRGMTVTETWTTSNVLSTEVELENSIAKGMKLILNGSLLPSVGQRNAKATAEYKQDNVNVRSSIDLFRGPTVNSDIVVGSDGFLLGGEAAYDVQDAKITKYNTAAGYNGKDYSVAMTAYVFLTLTNFQCQCIQYSRCIVLPQGCS